MIARNAAEAYHIARRLAVLAAICFAAAIIGGAWLYFTI